LEARAELIGSPRDFPEIFARLLRASIGKNSVASQTNACGTVDRHAPQAFCGSGWSISIAQQIRGAHGMFNPLQSNGVKPRPRPSDMLNCWNDPAAVLSKTKPAAPNTKWDATQWR